MNAGRGSTKWHFVVGAVTVGVFGAAIMLHGAPEVKRPTIDTKKAETTRAPAVTGGKVRLRARPGIPQVLRVLPASRADYRRDDTFAVQIEGNLVKIGPVRDGWATPNQDQLVGGTAAAPCTSFRQCNDCNYCTKDECVSGSCVNTLLNGSSPPGCDDTLFCNGQETCVTGVCTNGTPVPCDSGFYCEEGEAEGVCVPDCTTDPQCNDNDPCTTDTCDTGTNECVYTNACGPDADCSDPGPPDGCGLGRCCTGGGGEICPDPAGCTETTDADCAGTWLATKDTACAEVSPSLNCNACPGYGSGIADQGEFKYEIGIISELACDDYISVGDDYDAPSISTTGYMELRFLRFAGGVEVETPARWDIRFYDKDEVFIENVFWPDGSDDSAEDETTIKTVDFDPPLTVPTEGIIVWEVQENFSADGRVTLLTTDAVDVGSNDAGRMWVDGAMIDSANPAWPPGLVDGILAFEIVGTEVAEPLGACCNSGTPDCLIELPWICKDQGNIFQGVGTFCSFCSNNPFTFCSDSIECGGCKDDMTVSCTTDQECIDANAGDNCDLSPVCIPVPPACFVSACCDKATGLCAETAGGDCAGNVCSNNPFDDTCTSDGDCAGSGTCITLDGFDFQGFGTDCDPDCCLQPNPTGGDHCGLVSLQVINIPAVGDPPVSITLTGDNRAATFAGYPDWCDRFAPGPESGPPWWEGFSLAGECANVRLDMCCTDIFGEPLKPAWGGIWTDCPCTGSKGNVGVVWPIGEGRGTSGFARGEPFCNEDNLWQTFLLRGQRKYYYSFYSNPDGTAAVPPGADYQFHVTVGACPIAACCTGDSCEVVNELECADRNGKWLAYENLPDDVNNVVSCGVLPEENPCRTGSCCRGPGDCEDRCCPPTACDRANNPDTTCINKAGCDTLGGNYVGGASCDYPISPCPICTIRGDTNCQDPGLAEGAYNVISDLSILPLGVATADDFVPSTTEAITQVCTWGVYMDGRTCDSGDGPGCDCAADVTDSFVVTVYGDAGGYPDTSNVIGTSPASSVIKGEVPCAFATGSWEDAQCYEFQLTLGTAIGPLAAGQVHWLEIVNNTVDIDPEGGERCAWNWMHSPVAYNKYSVAGTSLGYDAGAGRKQDMAFCLNINLDAVPDVEAPCCNCYNAGNDPSVCTDAKTRAGCGGDWELTESSCAAVEPCPTEAPFGDWCVDGLIPISGEVSISTSTYCATTDGEPTVLNMGSDMWYAYTAECTGRLTVSMCATGNADNSYDSAVGVYKDNIDPTHCPCPDDPGYTRLGDPSPMDEGCDGLNNGGAGILNPPPVLPGHCLTIRVAGYENGKGMGHLSIGCEPVSCFPSSAPEGPSVLEEVTIVAGANTATTGDSIKNRYISVQGGDRGRSQGLRITFGNDLPPPHDVWNGMEMWVKSIREICENGGASGPPPNCPHEPNLPKDSFWGASTTCEPSAALFTDWTQYELPVHIFSEGFVPGATYTLQFIDETCQQDDSGSYSEPLVVQQAKWGDVLNACNKNPCSAPQGITNIGDVTGVLAKFQNLPGAPIKSRSDLVGLPGNEGVVDHIISIIDVTWDLDAFVGGQYAFAAVMPRCGTAGAIAGK